MTTGPDATPPAVGGAGGTSYRCADAAQRRHDPLLATAPPVSGWLLIEESGSWGADGLTTSPIDPVVTRELAARTARENIRVQLIRRSGRRHRRSGERAVGVVRNEFGRERVRWTTVTSDRELLDVPVTPDGDAAEPVYLVCTHGRRDLCCALRGRPVAAELARHRPEHTWETSHVGGDRFAANLVVLPHGLYYGQLTAGTTLGVVEAYEAGQVVPHHLRGRSSHPRPVQAAECYARLELSELRLGALSPRDVVQVDADTWRVTLTRDDRLVDVTVRTVDSPLPAQLTCGTKRATHYRGFDLVSLAVT